MSDSELLALTSKNLKDALFNSLDSFVMENQIGKGHFSVVYKGRSLKDGMPVALKKVQLFEMVDAKARLDYMKEINLLQQLNHPNIVRYLASFIECNELYIILELADAGDLSRMIKHFRRHCKLIPERTIWKYFVQICSALEHMHSKSIMHRDIKPANVLMTSNGVIKLGDLGLSRFFSPNTKVADTLVGTPYYMSPERIHEKPYTINSDIWSLGCLLYEFAALQSPFYGDHMNIYMLCKRIERSDYCPLPSDIYSFKMRQLIASCLAPEPSARPNIQVVHKIAQEMNQLMIQNHHFQSSDRSQPSSVIKINSDYESRRQSFNLNKEQQLSS